MCYNNRKIRDRRSLDGEVLLASSLLSGQQQCQIFLVLCIHPTRWSGVGYLEGVHGSLVPHTHQSLGQHGCSTFTKWPWKISSKQKKTNPLRQQIQWMCNVLWHQAGTRDESWLREEITSYSMTSLPSGAARCFSRDSRPPRPRTPTGWWRAVGRQNGEDHWANYLIAGTDQYDTRCG